LYTRDRARGRSIRRRPLDRPPCILGSMSVRGVIRSEPRQWCRTHVVNLRMLLCCCTTLLDRSMDAVVVRRRRRGGRPGQSLCRTGDDPCFRLLVWQGMRSSCQSSIHPGAVARGAKAEAEAEEKGSCRELGTFWIGGPAARWVVETTHRTRKRCPTESQVRKMFPHELRRNIINSRVGEFWV